ncbi:MAG TPA: hypothetical protein VN281_20520 [Verrucomicrobiae bacterium]|nr:hypothetical protein [Verrucomicrobiae bacterium]
MRRISPVYVIALLAVVCFTLGTCLEPRAAKWDARSQSSSLLTILLGDGKRMFANHFFVKADVYFHNGYYPSWMDQGMETVDTAHLTEEGHDELAEAKHEKAMDFLGQPSDWIERFGRNFYPSTHEHLDKPGDAGEILPWLRLSADMDPQRIETYTVGAFWLRLKMGKVDEAEQFLREGLRANPDSYAILLDLGRLYDENRHEAAHARNLWELGLRRWHEQEQAHKKPDETVLLGLLIHLADLEERQGNLEQALQYREKELSLTPQPDYVKKEIENLRAKLEAKTAGATNQKGGKPSEK